MQAYHARYEKGRVVPTGSPIIPEGSHIILTVLDTLTSENPVRKQRKAIDKLREISECDETLSPEFDTIVNQRANLFREVEV